MSVERHSVGVVELAEIAKDSVRQGDFVFAAWPFAVADPRGAFREATMSDYWQTRHGVSR